MRKGKTSGESKEQRSELSPASRKKVGKVVILMTKVFHAEIIEAACEREFGIPENEVGAVIEAARAELIKATDCHVREEYGRALISLQELFTSSVKIKDNKTALAIMKEIIRLRGLYDREQQNKESPESAELALIQQQVIPFVPNAKDDTPVAELVRLVLIEHTRILGQTNN